MNLLEKITSGFAAIMAALADLKVSMSAKADTSTEVTELKATIHRQEQEIAGLKKSQADADHALMELNGTVQGHVKTISDRDAEITQLKAEAKTAAERAQEMLAAQNIPISQLPAGESNFGEGEVGALRKQLSAETDPQKKFELSMKIRELSTKKTA